MTNKESIVYQGIAGANSHIACLEVFPDYNAVARDSFEDAFAAVASGEVKYGMIPIENSVAGRVADIHHLMPESGLYIVGEHFLRVNHQLVSVKGAKIDDIKVVYSHIMALNQCRHVIGELGVKPIATVDTAGAADAVAKSGDINKAAIASRLAANIYGLDILRSNIEDAEHNTTRFIFLAKEPNYADISEKNIITSLVFKVRNVPSALYKALGGFATNGVNLTKLESYQLEGSFSATQFYADIDGHINSKNVKFALEELEFFTEKIHILGVYKASPLRNENILKEIK